MKEEQFYKELTAIPEGRDGEYDAIMVKVASVKSRRHAVYALAASLILAVGLFTVSFKDNPGVEHALKTDDVSTYAEALDEVSDYFDGSALDDDFEIYAYSYSE